MTSGISDEGFNELLNYDKMGNIASLNRNPMGTNTYSYSGNRLTAISGFVNSTYTYDVNGNQTGDSHKGIIMDYNYLNLPETINKASTSETMTNTWLATGTKIRKTVGGMTREYVGGIEYNDGQIEFIQTAEGRAIPTGSSGYRYEYMLKDHLGNTRVLLEEDGTVLETSDYYPFGLQVARGQTVISPENRYKYNGKELQTELELGQNDYGARFYDPVVGRWNVVDPLAEKGRRWSPYTYVFNNPIRFIDPDGMWSDDIFNKRGRLIQQTSSGNNILVKTDNGSIVPITNLPLTRSNAQTIAQIGGYYGQQVGIQRGVVGVGAHSKNASFHTLAFTRGNNILLNRKNGKLNNSLQNYNNLKSVLIHEKYHLDRDQGFNEIGNFQHAEIYLKQISDPTFKETTSEFKEGILSSFTNYLKASSEKDGYQDSSLQDIINASNSKLRDLGYKINFSRDFQNIIIDYRKKKKEENEDVQQ